MALTPQSQPTLPDLIEQLQNINLLSEQVAQGSYALHRSIEALTSEVATAIGQVDPQILEAIQAPASL